MPSFCLFFPPQFRGKNTLLKAGKSMILNAYNTLKTAMQASIFPPIVDSL
jgi:hypothetical protein